PDTIVGVVGAGAMGAGIAQVAATAGHRVVLADAADGATRRAEAAVAASLEREFEKKRLDRNTADAIRGRIDFQPDPLRGDSGAFSRCGLVIEAVVEDVGVKQSIFGGLEQVVRRDALLATNTSSLSVASLASACKAPERD